jgi:hypothetical protein
MTHYLLGTAKAQSRRGSGDSWRVIGTMHHHMAYVTDQIGRSSADLALIGVAGA